jgi:hypothetical protein
MKEEETTKRHVLVEHINYKLQTKRRGGFIVPLLTKHYLLV